MGATHDCVAYGYPRNAYVNQPVQRYAQYPLYGCYPNYANQYQLPADCVTNNRAIKHDGPTTFGPNSAITTYSSQTMQKTSIQGCLGSLSTHSYNNSPGGTSFQSEGATSGIYPPPRLPFESFNHVPPPPLLYRDWTPSTFI